MKNLKIKKEEYLKRLKNYEELIISLTINEKNYKLLKILLLPKTESELEYANKYLTFFQDNVNITESATNGNTQEIDFNNCTLMNYMSDFTKLIYNDATEIEIENFKKSIDATTAAEILFQNIILTTNPPENIVEIIKNKCNLDISNTLRLIEFYALLDQIIEIYVPKNINKESMKKFIDYADKFHRLCVKNMIKHNEFLDNLIDSYNQKKKKM